MKINILDIPVYYINLESKTERKNSLEIMLKEKGFTNIKRFSGISADHPSIGCALSHQALLEKLVLEGIDTPFIVLEDDVSVTNHFVNSLEIPDDSDAIYLGLTMSARTWNYTVNDITAKKINDEYYQIYNLLAAHAILYTNMDYVKFLSKAIKTAISVYGHQDIVRASTMKFFNVYAQNKPSFYQNDTNRRIDLQTNIILDKMNIVPPTSANLGFTCHCYLHAGK